MISDFVARTIAKILETNLRNLRSWQQMKKNPRSWQENQDAKFWDAGYWFPLENMNAHYFGNNFPRASQICCKIAFFSWLNSFETECKRVDFN